MIPEGPKFSNGRAPDRYRNHEVPEWNIRDQYLEKFVHSFERWIKYLSYDCEHVQFVYHDAEQMVREFQIDLEHIRTKFKGWSK